MSVLFEGVKEFSATDFRKNKELFRRLETSQNPHTLFIGCSDSRVVPDLITRSLPGDLFVVRNIANIVPRYRASSEYLATTAAIEYAVQMLHVDHIVVCGHSNCGGCKALSLPETSLEVIPHTKKWLELVKDARRKAEEICAHAGVTDEFDWLVEQENVIEQMNHLLSYPFIADSFDAGKLDIFGWYYDIGSGKVYNYCRDEKEFQLIE